MLLHLTEIYRILKPGGRYRVVAPAALRFVERYVADDHEFFSLAFPWAQRPMEAVRDIIYFAGDHKNVLDFRELDFLAKAAGFSASKESSANSSEIESLRIDKSDPQRIAESLYVEMIKEAC
jgi:predicted SAM-dependent methyltransferase